MKDSFKALEAWMFVLIAVSFAMIVAAGAGMITLATVDSGPADSEPRAISSSPVHSPVSKPSIGAAVTQGAFTVKVHNVSPGQSSVGDQYLGKTANGKFIIVKMTVTNIGIDPQYFVGSDQFLIDKFGRKSYADDEALIYVSDKFNAFTTEINPGNSITGVIVFDVAKDYVPTILEFHSSMYSPGIAIQLSK